MLLRDTAPNLCSFLSYAEYSSIMRQKMDKPLARFYRVNPEDLNAYLAGNTYQIVQNRSSSTSHTISMFAGEGALFRSNAMP